MFTQHVGVLVGIHVAVAASRTRGNTLESDMKYSNLTGLHSSQSYLPADSSDKQRTRHSCSLGGSVVRIVSPPCANTEKVPVHYVASPL